MDFCFQTPSLLALIAGLRQRDNAFKHTSSLQDHTRVTGSQPAAPNGSGSARASKHIVTANRPSTKQFDHPVHVVLGTKTKVRDAEPSSDLFDGTNANSIIGFGVFRAAFDWKDTPGSDKEIMFFLRKFRFGVVACLHLSIL
jgi:hypothetical protein